MIPPVSSPHQVFVDATYGRGGHSRALLQRIGNEDRLIGIDRDPEAVADGRALSDADARFSMVHGRFSLFAELVGRAGVDSVSGAIFDLGVSSPQFDDAGRGFSFRAEGPVDMRMDPTAGQTAGAWLDQAEEAEIADVLKRLGEERHARRIARAIVAARPFHSTAQLADVVEAAQPHRRNTGKHDATRTFQAIRMHVNDELSELEAGLQGAFSMLRQGGRLAIISFHSLEDRLVKRAFKALARDDRMPRRLPVRAVEHQPKAALVGRAVRASDAEVASNPRARSATLRVLERIG